MTANQVSIILRAFFIPVILLTAAIASAEPTRKPPGGEPQDVLLEWNPTHLDIHAKEGEAKVHIDFGVSNPSREVVVIHKIAPSCGCTVADHMKLPREIKPGNRETIGLTISLAGKHGTLHKSVTVISSAGRKDLTFTVTLPASAGRAQTMTLPERMNNIAIASKNRQAVFQGECRSCHVDPTVGRHGEELYRSACGICHDTPQRAFMVPDLRKLAAGEDYWRFRIRDGKPDSLMPAFQRSQGGPLTDVQIEELANYLATRGVVTAPPPNPADFRKPFRGEPPVGSMHEGHEARWHPSTKLLEPNEMKMKSNMNRRIALLALSAATASTMMMSAQTATVSETPSEKSEWSKDDSIGNDLLSAGYAISASKVAGISNFEINAEASAWAKAFGTEQTIGSGGFQAGADSEKGRMSGKIKVLERILWEDSISRSTSFSGTVPIATKEKVLGKATFMVGPIPVSLAASMSVSCSVDYEGGIIPSSTPGAYGRIVPKFDTAGAASIGVDAIIVAAGVRVNVDFIKIEVPCEASIAMNSSGGYTQSWDVDLDLESLSGSMDAWVRIGVDGFSKTYDKEIFRWDGFEKSISITSGSSSTSLVMGTYSGLFFR